MPAELAGRPLTRRLALGRTRSRSLDTPPGRVRPSVVGLMLVVAAASETPDPSTRRAPVPKHRCSPAGAGSAGEGGEGCLLRKTGRAPYLRAFQPVSWDSTGNDTCAWS